MTTELVELADKWDRQAAGNYDDRANALSRCADELRALASRAGGWRPIDSAPRDGTEVLLWGTDGQAVIGEWLKCASPYWLTGLAGDLESTYTHFQPLPEPPAAPEPVAVGVLDSGGAGEVGGG